MQECLFCKIAGGEIDADVVHTSEHVVAFRDINPQAPVHILIIPKEHIESAKVLGEKQADLLAEIFAAAAHLAKANEVDKSGWRLVTNVGAQAGQSVHHLHFHLLGGRAMGWPPG
jgi:histidine triad (HIT) family protein